MFVIISESCFCFEQDSNMKNNMLLEHKLCVCVAKGNKRQAAAADIALTTVYPKCYSNKAQYNKI